VVNYFHTVDTVGGRVDNGSRVGYRRVADELRRRIDAGTYQVGGRLPSYEALAEEFRVSRNVARSAVEDLREEGLVETTHGIGSTVLYTSTGLRELMVESGADGGALMREVARMRQRLEQVAAEVADLRREVRGDQQPPAPAGRAARPSTPAQTG
jgi:DNA-binding FadR family transcriptional regulator